jgi:hypothetical protein
MTVAPHAAARQDRPQLLTSDHQREAVLGSDAYVDQLVSSLRPRLPGVAPEGLPGLVRTALDALGEVRVTTYLPILVERRVRADLARDDNLRGDLPL